MKARLHSAFAVLLCAVALPHARGASFQSGSTGAYGPLDITADTTLDVPGDGMFHCTTITVAQDATLRFNRNPLNTPVHLLATGDVAINGVIDVSGGGSPGGFVGGPGGPGGFDGGPGGFSTVGQVLPGGAGLGPGAGRSGNSTAGNAAAAGAGAYGTRTQIWLDNRDGQTYGTALLIPLLGGSGGGGVDGNRDAGGGGGGGAILIASSTIIRVHTTGSVVSRGGVGWTPNSTGNGGSGGGIRLLAPRVYGTGTLDVRGSGYASLNSGNLSGAGRIRIDSIFPYEPTSPGQDNIGFAFQPSSVTSIGRAMLVFPPNNPRLDILQAAGRAIAEGNNGPVFVELPFGSNTNQTVTVQARDFARDVPIRVVLTPAAGDPIVYDSEILNQASNPAQVVVNVGIPINTVVAVNAWTRE
jgi:hypothetical protein